MIEKQINFFYGDNNSEVVKLLHPNALEKNAGISNEILDYLKTMKATKGKSYALINALSAGEFYGSNRNGDYFPEQSLKDYHKTFELFGHVYRHHVNKDPEQSMGKVIFAFYNPKMHRVELVVELDNSRAKDVIEDLEKGKLPASSMGCKVPWDECSICGNRARVRSEYCSHLKDQLNRVLPGGKKVYAINRKPKFFDISIVLIPAEKTSGVLKMFKELFPTDEDELKKVAFYSEKSYTKLADFSNLAEISKNIESAGEVKAVADDPKELARLIELGQTRLKEDTLKKLASYPVKDVLSTMLGLRIVPEPRDFQKLALYSQGQNDIADKLENDNVVFEIDEKTESIVPDDLSLDNFNEKIANLLLNELPALSLTKEFLVARSLVKIAEPVATDNAPINSTTIYQPQTDDRAIWKKMLFDNSQKPERTAHKNPIVPLGILGGLYMGYAKIFNDPSTSGFRTFMLKNPWLLPVIIGGATVGSLWAQDATFNKTAAGVDAFMRNSLISFPVSYYLAGAKEYKVKQGKPISGTEDFIRKHPALTALAGSLAGISAEKFLTKKFTKVATFINRLPESEIDRIYIDLQKLKWRYD